MDLHGWIYMLQCHQPYFFTKAFRTSHLTSTEHQCWKIACVAALHFERKRSCWTYCWTYCPFRTPGVPHLFWRTLSQSKLGESWRNYRVVLAGQTNTFQHQLVTNGVIVKLHKLSVSHSCTLIIQVLILVNFLLVALLPGTKGRLAAFCIYWSLLRTLGSLWIQKYFSPFFPFYYNHV